MAERRQPAVHPRLDRGGRALVILGAFVLGPLVALLALGAAWFISYFGDGSGERGLAAMADVWPVWLFSLVVIAIAVMTLAWVVRGGRLALASAGVGGFAIGVVGLTMLVTGQHDATRSAIILASAIGSITLASGAVARLVASA